MNRTDEDTAAVKKGREKLADYLEAEGQVLAADLMRSHADLPLVDWAYDKLTDGEDPEEIKRVVLLSAMAIGDTIDAFTGDSE